MCFICFLFFFFKQKTAYEMRISDWSSDVCSSDLLRLQPRAVIALERNTAAPVELKHPAHDIVEDVAVVGNKDDVAGVIDDVIFQQLHALSVKMVGRFVKQQNVRLFQPQPATREAALFTARMRTHVTIARRAPDSRKAITHPV